MNRYAKLILGAWLACGSALAESRLGPVPPTIQFNRDVRPILSENCYACHGPDKNKRKAKLRLDIETGALADLGGHSAIVPGQLEKSELYRRITTLDEDDHMPPAKSGRKLSPRDIQILTRWIEQGAKWQPHWSYIPPVRPDAPKVKNRSWSKNPIDYFILSRLEAERLRPSREADRRTLIRRLSFDLIGLPPSFEEVETFVRDKRPQACEQLVDRLLDSPHYGERMAIHWLDLARYADTDGYHGDNYRSVYPYRDYVIEAFNDNISFDRFTLEQIAGDLLPDATLPQKIASTYNRLNRTTFEGGSQAKEYLAKYAADRVRTTSAVWLGGTMGCAECHDHKFDPYSTKDFYRFAAFFADVKEEGVALPEPVLLPNEKQAEELKRLNEPIAQAEKSLEAVTNQLLATQASWEATMKADLEAGRLDWKSLKPDQFVSRNGATLKLQDDLSVLASGENPTNDHYTVTVSTDLEHITALRMEALTDPSHEKQGLSRGNGNFVLTSFEVELATNNSTPEPIKIALATADFSQTDFPIAAAIDDKPDTGWAVEGYSKISNRRAVFTFAQPIPGGLGTKLTVRLKHDSQFAHHNIGRFRLALSTVTRPTWTDHGLPEKVVQALRKSKDSRTPEQTNALTQYYLDSSPAVAQAREALAAARKPKDEFVKNIPTTLASVSVEPRVMRVLPRGNWMDESGEIVAPTVPQFLSKAAHKSERATRLDLARWLASRDNPMAARAFVNRLWKLYFGTGISRVLDDLGAQGEWPKHPELLDWLAVEFMESGWDIKHMVRLMVTSRTYRQSSDAEEKLLERDPDNRLLARQSRFRLAAEMVRDNALATSGMLARKMGGPSVKPYQPAGYWDQLNFPKRTYENDKGEETYRRGLYTYWCRTFLHPSLLAFDASSREECTVERVDSNTPLQALVLLNDPTYVEAARVLAEQMIRKGGANTDERINWAFSRTLARQPKQNERKTLSALYRKQLEHYNDDKAAAEKLVRTGDWAAPRDLNFAELAAWTSVARVILNLHEMVMRY